MHTDRNRLPFSQFVMIGMVLWTISDSKGFDGFIVGGVCLGFGLRCLAHRTLAPTASASRSF